MAMHMVRKARKLKSTMLQDTTPKRSPSSLPVAEDTEKANRVFVGGVYNMILMASTRAYDLYCGALPLMPMGTHTPKVQALLEIENGLVTHEYVPQFRKKVEKKAKNS